MIKLFINKFWYTTIFIKFINRKKKLLFLYYIKKYIYFIIIIKLYFNSIINHKFSF